MNREEHVKRRTLAFRDALVSLYQTVQAARRVADDASIPLEHIRFEGSIIEVWHQILIEAEKHGRLSALGEIASREYQADLQLQRVMASIAPLIPPPLEALYVERDGLEARGLETGSVNARIIELKRKLRHGPELHPNEYLSDRYRLLEIIGDGGFGTVWKAYDRRWSRLVAIKVLHGQHTRDNSIVERFQRGSRAMARLPHPNVVKIESDHAEDDAGFHYFVMEFIEGENLESAVLSGKLEGTAVLPLIQEIGKALQHSHSKGVIHRDVTPANVLLRTDGTPLLTDFDLALVSGSTAGTRGGLGTIPYAAPETWTDASVADERVDVYSLGMLMVFALSRQSLNLEHFINRQALIRTLPCSDAVKVAISRAVERDPRQRHPSVAEFCKSLVTPPSRELLEAYLGVQPGVSEGEVALSVRSLVKTEKRRREVVHEVGGKRPQQQRYKIPETNRRKLIEALEKFDRESREQKRWQNFVKHPRHKYGILHEGRLYPVKEILKRATGLDNGKFTGGAYANARIAELGFKIVRLRDTDSVDHDAVAGRLFREGDNQEEFGTLGAERREVLLSWIRQTYTQANTLYHATSTRLRRDFEAAHGFHITNGAFKGAMAEAGFQPADELQRNWRFKIRPAAKSANKKRHPAEPGT